MRNVISIDPPGGPFRFCNRFGGRRLRPREQGEAGRGFHSTSMFEGKDGSIFMVGQREGFKNRFGPHGAEVTSVRFRIRKPCEGEGVELLPIGGPS